MKWIGGQLTRKAFKQQRREQKLTQGRGEESTTMCEGGVRCTLESGDGS